MYSYWIIPYQRTSIINSCEACAFIIVKAVLINHLHHLIYTVARSDCNNSMIQQAFHDGGHLTSHAHANKRYSYQLFLLC